MSNISIGRRHERESVTGVEAWRGRDGGGHCGVAWRMQFRNVLERAGLAATGRRLRGAGVGRRVFGGPRGTAPRARGARPPTPDAPAARFRTKRRPGRRYPKSIGVDFRKLSLEALRTYVVRGAPPAPRPSAAGGRRLSGRQDDGRAAAVAGAVSVERATRRERERAERGGRAALRVDHGGRGGDPRALLRAPRRHRRRRHVRRRRRRRGGQGPRAGAARGAPPFFFVEFAPAGDDLPCARRWRPR